MAPKKNESATTEVLADAETVERLLQELSKDSLDGASGGFDEYGFEGYGGGFESYGGDQSFAYDDSSYYQQPQQFAAAHCMICGARCGSWGDGPVPTGSQGGRRIG